MSAPLFDKHKRVLIVTSIWIYHFEQHPKFAEPAGRLIGNLEDGKFRGIASELTLLELTVRPLQTADGSYPGGDKRRRMARGSGH